jgi:hypothetical protein
MSTGRQNENIPSCPSSRRFTIPASPSRHRLSGVSDVLEAQVSVHTPSPDPERRAVDVNRPVTPLVRSCCDAGHAGHAGTNRYRGINIHCSPCHVGSSPKDDFRCSSLRFTIPGRSSPDVHSSWHRIPESFKGIRRAPATQRTSGGGAARVMFAVAFGRTCVVMQWES